MTTTTTATSPRDQLYADLFTTALEGGIGYWSQAASYHWSNPDGSEDVRGFYADIVDVEEGDKPHRIDRTVVARGFRLAVANPWRNRLAWSSGEKPPVIIDADTDWDFDAGDADMIVQLGLFADVVYG